MITPRLNNQDVDVEQLEAENGLVYQTLDQAIETLRLLWLANHICDNLVSDPELVGDDIEDTKSEYITPTLEDRANKVSEQGKDLLLAEWTNEDGR